MTFRLKRTSPQSFLVSNTTVITKSSTGKTNPSLAFNRALSTVKNWFWSGVCYLTSFPPGNSGEACGHFVRRCLDTSTGMFSAWPERNFMQNCLRPSLNRRTQRNTYGLQRFFSFYKALCCLLQKCLRIGSIQSAGWAANIHELRPASAGDLCPQHQ